jgi:epoxyqueuosine reductase
MNEVLKEEALKHGDRLQFIKAEHLKELKGDIEEFKNSEELNGFQQWIVNDLYSFDIPETEFKIRSVILLAAHHPFYANIGFTYAGKSYKTKCLVHSEFQESKKYLEEALHTLGYHMLETRNLPLKRLAVQGGIAQYGRNNITYIDGLGSNFSYMAFFTDAPCERDEWRKVCHADFCDTCNACVKLCPTGAIRADRFLMDNQRCLSCMNESGGELPEWLSKEVHHTLYDCLRCQEKCPLNKAALKDIIGPLYFSEEETELLLAGKGPEAFSEEFRGMADRIGLFDWPEALPRNIRAIMEASES